MRALPGSSARTSRDISTYTTRRGAAEAQRRRIRRALVELVAKRGYNDVSVKLIGERAHVSPNTFYKHYSGKEECFLELFDLAVAQMRERVRDELPGGPDAAWADRVAAAVRTIFTAIVEDPMLARALIVEAPAVGPAIASRYEAATGALAPLLREGRESSPFGEELPKTLEDSLASGVLWSAYQRLVADEIAGIEAFLPEAVEFLVRPYLGDEEARRAAGAVEPISTGS
jgi:AcrR family transcriptional regulator